jgi:hypothetical protein
MKAAEPYLDEDSLRFVPDKNGPGGILRINPIHDAGSLEEIWELDGIPESLMALRDEILDGDLRPLYLAHLAIGLDMNHHRDETTEGPVPAGLNKITVAQSALAEFVGVDDALIAAAAKASPPLPQRGDKGNKLAEWLHGQPVATKDRWLTEWLSDPEADVRSEILARFRKSRGIAAWPTAVANRTIAQLESIADDIANESKRKAAEKAARERAKRLATMAADPTKTLRETEKLVAERNSRSYRKAAELLADLREALSGTDQAGLAESQAVKLKRANPTLKLLTGELRRHGFVPK